MSLPVGVTTATLTIGRPFDAFGNYGTLKVSITPVFGGTAQRLVWTATGETFEAFTLDVGTDPDGDATETFTLPHVNQSGWVDGSGNAITNWAYKIDVTPTMGSGAKKARMPRYTKWAQPLTTDSTVDIDKLPDGTAAAPTVGASSFVPLADLSNSASSARSALDAVYTQARAVDLRAASGVDPTGATDCSTAMQAAVTTAISQGAPVAIPYGRYKGTITWAPGNNKNISLRGDGDAVLVAPTDGTPVVTIDGGTSNLQMQRVGNFKIDRNGKDTPGLLLRSFGQIGVVENVLIDGMATTPTRAAVELGDGTTAPNDIVFATLRNIEVRANDTTKGVAFLFRSRGDSVTLESCRGVHIGTGFANNPATAFGGSDIVFDRCIVEEVTTGWSFTGINAASLRILAPRAEAFSSVGIDLSGVDSVYTLAGVLIDAGFFTGMTAGSIGVRLAKVGGAELVGNVFKALSGSTAGSYPLATPLSLGTAVTGLRMRGNLNEVAIASDNSVVAHSVGSISGTSGILPSANIATDQESLDLPPRNASPQQWISGRYYGTPAGSPGTGALPTGFMTASPVFVPNDVTIDRIGTEITAAAASSVVRLGIYSCDTAGRPTTLVADCGTVDASTTGEKTITISQALPRGLYYLAAAVQGAGCTVRHIGFSEAPPVSSTTLTGASSATTAPNCYTSSTVTGALPSTLATNLAAGSGATKVRIRVA